MTAGTTASFRYDCANCKFNWCCNDLCECKLDLPIVPSIQRQVDEKKAAWRLKMSQTDPAEVKRKFDNL
jgi:hypothetical protein